MTHLVCDRCHKEQPDSYVGDVFSAGVYITNPGSMWHQYANRGENIVCDACMWADPSYRWDYK